MSKISLKKIVASTLLFFIIIFNVFFVNNLNFFKNDFFQNTTNNVDNIAKIDNSIINNDVLDSNANSNNYILSNNNVQSSITTSKLKSNQNDEIVKLDSNKEVYLGGIPIGIKVGANGVIVTGFNDINNETNNNPFKNTLVQIGDVIEQIDNNKINNIRDLENVVNNSKGKVSILFRKNNQKFTVDMCPKVDKISGKKVLGLKVKDSVYGIGTLTYVDINKRFGSLGHHIIDSSTGACNILNNGQIYNSYITNAVKGSTGVAGHLNGMIIEENTIGNVDKNINFGLYGTGNDNIVKGLKKIEIASHDEVVLGKAQIYTTIEGIKPKLYDVEIVKVSRQNRPQERSMIVRVIDKELIAKTGGIVQGMSGSPIIQNGKLIGALTHVFLNDSKKGFGLFIDWMLPN